MGYYTDAHVADLPSLHGLSSDDVQRTLDDAATIYQAVGDQPGVDDASLRGILEATGVTVDRANRALALLTDTGKLVQLRFDPQPVTPAGTGSGRRPSKRTRRTK